MKTIKIGKYEWYLVKELADKTLLFATSNIVDGYFDNNTNDFTKSKVCSFLNSVFKNSLKSADFDPDKIINGIWLVTSIQYENYIKPLCPPIESPFLLRTPDEKDGYVKFVNIAGEIKSIGIKEQMGIRPGFMLDTVYVNELLQNKKNTEKEIKDKPTNTKDALSIMQSENLNSNKEKIKGKNVADASTSNNQTTADRIKPPIFNQNTQQNNQNDKNQNNQNKKYNSHGTENSQRNKKNKQKKNAKKKSIEIAKPTQQPVLTKPQKEELFEVNMDELSCLAEMDINTSENTTAKETSIATNIPSTNNTEEINTLPIIENHSEKNISTASLPIEEKNKESIDIAHEKEQDSPRDDVEDITEIVDITAVVQPVIDKTETKQEIPKQNDEPVVIQHQSPFSEQSKKKPEKSSKKMNKSNNETFASTIQEKSKKGQNVIMSKLGAIDMSAESEKKAEMTTAITAYTQENANTSIKKQTMPSTYSQNMSEINQFTIDQLREILIKRNKQITKLKLSLIETTAEHEALIENISKTKTEIEKYKADIESYETQIEQMQKENRKLTQVADEEKNALIKQHENALNNFSEQLQIAQQNLTNAQSEIESLLKKNNELENKITEMTSDANEKEKEMQEYKTLLEKNKTNDAEILRQNDSLVRAEQTITECKEKISVLEKEISMTKTEKEELVTNIEALKKELTEKSLLPTESISSDEKEELNKLRDENTELKADMVKALRIAKKLKEDLTEITSKVEQQAITIKELTQKLSEFHSENESLKVEVERYKAFCEEKREKINELEISLKQSKEKNEELQSIIGNNAITMQNMNSEIEKIKKENNNLNANINKNSLVIDTLTEGSKKKDEEIKKLSEQLAVEKESKEKTTALEQQIASLKLELSEKDKIIKDKENIIKKLSDDINSDFTALSDFKNLIFEE